LLWIHPVASAMATKKYTAAQLRKAREIIDQEEAIEYERERRTKLREARRDKDNRVAYTPKPISPPLKRSLILFFGGLFVMWAINGYFRLYAIASDDSLYRRFFWVAPLLWAGIVGLWHWANNPLAPKPLTSQERRWAKEFDDWNHGRRSTPPKGLSIKPPKPQQGKGDWFSIKEKKDSGQGDYS
jgi:hypothetical protein